MVGLTVARKGQGTREQRRTRGSLRVHYQDSDKVSLSAGEYTDDTEEECRMDFGYTVTTDKSVDEAVQGLAEALKSRKFGVLWDFDLTAKLREKEQPFAQPYRVLEVCNPFHAQRVISQDLTVGYFLPCKIVVYEGEDGTTQIGLPRPTKLMEVIGNPALDEVAKEVEDALIGAIDEAK